MAIQEVVLPELGEDIEFGDVVSVLVSEGDAVKKDQPLIEVETEKATVEIPSPFTGVVKEVRVKEGDRVKIGQMIATIDSDSQTKEEEEKPRDSEEEGDEEKGGVEEAEQEKDTTEIAREEATEGKRSEEQGEPENEEEEGADDKEENRGAGDSGEGQGRGDEVVPAGPAVRRMARELGLDIRSVSGSGPDGRILEQDVKDHARRIIQQGPESSKSRGSERPTLLKGEGIPPLPDFSRFGEVERVSMGGLRRQATKTTSVSWSLIPHVTQFDHADVTELENQRKRLGKTAEESGGKLSVTAILIKVVALALRRFPKFNASLDLEAEEIVYKKYINIGVAVDTDRGLVVPVIRDSADKSLVRISVELADLAGRARKKKLGLDEMRGSNFSVTNLGGLGTTYFTPIVTWPDVAVLGVGKAENRAVFQESAFVPRLILPLSISYDHRVIDGADASRFLRWIAEALETPLKLFLED